MSNNYQYSQQRLAIWLKLSDLADQLLELSCQWWDLDVDLVEAYYNDNPSTPMLNNNLPSDNNDENVF